MRFLICLALLASPAVAWEFTPTPICTLTHRQAQVDVTVTYDPALPPDAAQFGLTFNGPRGLAIGTSRHVLSGDRQSLTVADTGFGNVLDGLQFNDSATATTGTAVVTFDLTDAAPAVEAFRNCPAVVTS